MAYVGHTKVTFGGGLGNATPAAEEWSCSFRIGDPSGSPTVANPTTTTETAIVNALKNFIGGSSAALSSSVTMSWVKFSLMDATGHVVVDPATGGFVQELFPISPVTTGWGATAQHPFQIAQVVSLISARHGAMGKGRMYVPLPGSTVDANGLVSTTNRDSMVAAAQTLFNSVNTALTTQGTAARVIVASSKGFNSKVLSVRVGRVLDTHRTRRSRLPESYGIGLLS